MLPRLLPFPHPQVVLMRHLLHVLLRTTFGTTTGLLAATLPRAPLGPSSSAADATSTRVRADKGATREVPLSTSCLMGRGRCVPVRSKNGWAGVLPWLASISEQYLGGIWMGLAEAAAVTAVLVAALWVPFSSRRQQREPKHDRE